MARKFERSPLALAVLVLLHEAPMHPYRMQRLIKDRGKDQVINVEQRASLYQTINQLLRAGLIAPGETERAEGFPERTVYQLTEQGREAAVTWLREMLAAPAQDYPDFPAALSLLPLLTPEDGLTQLEARAERLAERLMALEAEITGQAGEGLLRLFLLESEYGQAVVRAELDWVRGLIADLRGGRLTWTHDWMHGTQSPAQDS